MISYLSKLKVNQVGKVIVIDKCCYAKKRLSELGVHKGASIKVVKNDNGPLIISLNGNKLALGRKLAENILIET